MVGCFSFISRLVLHHLELLLRWRTLHTPGAALRPETAVALNRSDGLDVAPANPQVSVLTPASSSFKTPSIAWTHA